ncbi:MULTISPECIES: Crp/Fnr family transcriptional regulator [unclassified Pannonibacter]|uniref:Crp/Fnr family transcriptional regulator n=1 Tax=unclassified Pannonibacter TaxID=2627228 RepID=UPI001648C235|nr:MULTISPECIES: Crp/Fnr family transcriptional regulator [unclassified Pannonibacter]
MSGQIAGRSFEEALRLMGLSELSEAGRRTVEQALRQMAIPAGTEVFAPGQACPGWLVLTSGSIRVLMTSDTGREILLYRVAPGESCVLTTSCLLGEEPYAASGITETACQAFMIPAGVVARLLDSEPVFRRRIFQGFSLRLASILRKMEDAMFHRLDARLARLLLELAGDGSSIQLTQAALAAETGSAREVIARLLGRWAEAGHIAQGRGEVRLVDPAALRRIADAG